MKRLDALGLELAGQQGSRPVLFGQLGIFFIIIHEESEILIRNVHVGIPTQSPVLFLSLPSTAKPVSVNLVLDLVGCIRHVDGAVHIGCAHLGPGTLQRGEEFRVQERGFGVSEFGGDVTREAEVWVLVDGAGDEGGDIMFGAKDLWVRVREGCGSLDGGKVNFADVVAAK